MVLNSVTYLIAGRPGAQYSFAPPPPDVVVCTSGVWSVEVSFVACDDYRVEIDGPAADNVRVSATVELEEP